MVHESAGVYHDWQRCPRAHATGDRLRQVEDTDGLEPCPVCVDGENDGGEKDQTDDQAGTCETVMSNGEVCGRETPCQYHGD